MKSFSSKYHINYHKIKLYSSYSEKLLIPYRVTRNPSRVGIKKQLSLMTLKIKTERKELYYTSHELNFKQKWFIFCVNLTKFMKL